jgi:hypothetical protein
MSGMEQDAGSRARDALDPENLEAVAKVFGS